MTAENSNQKNSNDPALLPKEIQENFRALRTAARKLRQLDTKSKSEALMRLADDILRHSSSLIEANKKDLASLAPDAASAFRDRLTLTPQRVEAMVESLRQVAALPDPVGEVIEERVLKNSLTLRRVRSPLGVIFMIFESRPNVILEAFSLAFKSGNAIALRGGSESKETAQTIYGLMRATLKSVGLSENSFYGMNDYDRALVGALLKRKDWIDVVVPRGGERLIEFVQNTALMPIIKNDRGLCHAYVDESADLQMAAQIVANGKTQRPGVCNALETLLVHQSVAETFLPMLYTLTDSSELRWRLDERSMQILNGRVRIQPADDTAWDTEYLDLILNCRIVNDLEAALGHIERHGSKHSETIITKSEKNARHFQSEVDAAAVYWNASTRFTDGFEFGLGGELGISTQKLHVRGPVGLRELTTPRWIIDGTGQIRS